MNRRTKRLSLLLMVTLLAVSMLGGIPFRARAEEPASPAAVQSPSGAELLSAQDLPAAITPEEIEEHAYTERLAEREPDLNTLLFRNADGTETLRVFAYPVKYVDETGTVRDILPDLYAAQDGSFRAVSSPLETVFPGRLGEGITLGYGGDSVTMFPLGAEQAEATLSDGTTVSYPYGEATTLEYSLTCTGFKEDIVVARYTGQTEYSFRLQTGGLTLSRQGDSYFLLDETGAVRFAVGDILVFTADERNNTLGELRAETIREGQEYLLTVCLNADYLADPKTAYPIRIDPSIDINYTQNGAGAIEDVTIIEQGYYYGTAKSLQVGRYETNGLCRTLMRFPNLSQSLSGISGGQITAATVELRDIICQGDEDITVDCHIYNMSATGWSEAVQATWSNVGTGYLGTLLDSKLITYGNGNVSGQSNRYAFNILTAAQAWANGTQDPAKGLVFKASSAFEGQTGNNVQNWHKTFASYNRASNQPSLSIEYSSVTPAITLGGTQFRVNIGGTLVLQALTVPAGQTVSYQVVSGTAATVTPNGVVTPVTPAVLGMVTVQASFNCNNTVYSTTCDVYVTIPDGVYRLKNNYSNLYLSTADRASVPVNVYQETADNGSETGLRQMWRIHYMASGYYSIRPLHYPVNGLVDMMGDAEVITIGESDVQSAVTLYAWWKIAQDNGSLVFSPSSSSTGALSLNGATTTSGANVLVGVYNGDSWQKWTAEPVTNVPKGVRWYSATTGLPITGSVQKYLALEDVKTPAQLQLKAVFYSGTNIGQQFTWSSTDTDVATVAAGTGEVTAAAAGSATISACKVFNNTNYCLTYALNVEPIANGLHFLKNKASNRYADLVSHSVTAGTAACQWAFEGTAVQQWQFSLLEDGYYTISPKDSATLYLGVSGDSTAQDASVILRAAPITDGMKWKVEATAAGYRIIPKTMVNATPVRVLALQNPGLFHPVDEDGLLLLQREYVADSNYKDEWEIVEPHGMVLLEPQKQSNWCWVASARMSSKIFMLSPVSQETAAVYVKKAVITDTPSSSQISESNSGGTVAETEQALEFILGSLNVYSEWGKIYSEAMLQTMIDNNNPVVVLR